ncbi:hypothetical protein HDU87_004793 [Geranomyces variabilis]|uniref:Trafficking protein particle complex subunit 10 n=1 Tax=Geranomyces variabilis TaxID=109894 RepID=A0AAD5XLL4_9FUNG|nr:hypothetical protein HDU87_004793 [Geranomyces variabilis]
MHRGEMGDNKRVIITYSYGPDGEEGGVGNQFAEELESRLPLRNIAWHNPLGAIRGSTNSTARIIGTLDVELKRYSPEMFPRAMPGTLYHSPYFLHLYLVTTDDSEVYKATTRKQIQEWLNVVANKKNQEWLIVYLINPDSKGKSARFLGVGASSVFDKIKSDFSFKKERCIRMKLQNDAKDAEAWTDLTNHLKEGITSSLNQQILQYDEDTRRIDQQRLMPGWNYCQYFIMKEGLAYTFEFMNLLEEALLQYDELEASFFQTLAEQGAPWFAKFGGSEPDDDSASILDLQRKRYRDMIMQNTISIFDFRVYLFARQCQLLFRLGRPVAICQRAKMFINQFSRTIHENEASIWPFFRQAWMYSACIQVIGHCDELVAVSTQQQDFMAMYDGVKVDLLQCARFQLDNLGAACGVYPNMSNTINSSAIGPENNAQNGDVKESLAKITNIELRSSLQSSEAFDELYLRITSRAIRSCQGSNRPRTRRILSGDLANLHFARSRYAEAAAVWEPIVGQDEPWPFLDDLFAEKLAQCWKMLKDSDRYLKSCLHLVTCSTISAQDRVEYYVDELVSTSSQVAQVLEVSGVSILKLKTLRFINTIEDDGRCTVTLNVQNLVKEELNFDEVIAKVISTDGIEYACQAQSITLDPGTKDIQLSGQRLTISGTYVVDHVTCRIGKLRLVYHNLGSFHVTGGAVPFSISAGLPDQSLSRDSSSMLQVDIVTGSAALKQGTLALSAPTLSFPFLKSVLHRKSSMEDDASHIKECTIDTAENRIVLPSIDSLERLSFQIPFQDLAKGMESEHRVKFSLTYTTADGISHVWHESKTLNTSTALAISHVIVHNATSPVIRYTLTGKRPNPMRILGLNVSASGAVDPVPLSDVANTVLYYHQEMPVICYLRSKELADVKSTTSAETTTKVQLEISYQDLDAEITNFFLSSLEKLLAGTPMIQFSGFLIRYVCETLVPLVDVAQYALTDVANLPPFVTETVGHMLRSEQTETIAKIEEFLNLFHDRLKTSSGNDVRKSQKLRPRRISYQVESPVPKVLLAVEIRRIDAPDASGHLMIGQPLKCQLIVSPQRWDHDATDLPCFCEISADPESWVFSGKRKRKAILTGKEPAIFPFTIIPIRTGYTLMPSVVVDAAHAKVAIIYHTNSLGLTVRAPSFTTKTVSFAT